jgi:hypothetical protein
MHKRIEALAWSTGEGDIGNGVDALAARPPDTRAHRSRLAASTEVGLGG